MTEHWLDTPQSHKRLSKLVRYDYAPWGRLAQLERVEDVLVQLKHSPAVLIPDYCTSALLVYHSRDLGIGLQDRICTTTITTAVSLKVLDPLTHVYLQYRYGNIFAFIKHKDLPLQVTQTLDVYFLVSRQENCLITHQIGKYHRHHQLYAYEHLDGKITTIEKLLASKRFNSVSVGTDEDFGLCDIPL